jgi:hypothetical protein
MTTPNLSEPNHHVTEFIKLERLSRGIPQPHNEAAVDALHEVVGIGITTFAIEDKMHRQPDDPYINFIGVAQEAVGRTQDHARAAQIILAHHTELIDSVSPETLSAIGGVEQIMAQQSLVAPIDISTTR